MSGHGNRLRLVTDGTTFGTKVFLPDGTNLCDAVRVKRVAIDCVAAQGPTMIIETKAYTVDSYAGLNREAGYRLFDFMMHDPEFREYAKREVAKGAPTATQPCWICDKGLLNVPWKALVLIEKERIYGPELCDRCFSGMRIAREAWA